MLKSSRRAFGVATMFTLGAVCFAPAASAGLLGGSGGGGNGLPVLSSVTDALPIVSNLPVVGGDLLGGGVGVGGLLGLSSLLGLDGGGGVLGGGLPVVGGLLGGGGGLPVVGGLLGGDSSDSGGGELLSVVTDTTLACDAAVPQVLSALLLGDLTETICAPFDNGVLGLLSSL